MAKKTFQYRIYPTKAQETILSGILRACRWVYNKTLEVRKEAWQVRQECVTRFDTQKLIPIWKAEHEFLKKAYAQSLQNVSERVELAFQAFFRRVKAGETPGFPRFRGIHRYASFTYPQSGFKLTDQGKLDLSKVGRVKIVLHRPMRGQVKTLAIKRTATGKWFACFACEVSTTPLPANSETVGVDMGLSHFATLSTGEAIENPRFFRQAEKALAKVQRRFSKEDKGTPARRFRRRAVALTHEKIKNRRKDFAHKLSQRLVKDFGTLCFENLNIKKLTSGWLAKSILEAAWSQLIQYTANKAACAGRSFVLVNPCNTSKRCSKCGVLVDKDLSVRVHECPACGLTMDCDHNAALNILRLGLQSFGPVPIEAPAC